MSRTLLLTLSALLVASNAGAEPITLSGSTGPIEKTSAADPVTMSLGFTEYDYATSITTTLAQATIANVGPSETTLVWLIDEGSAANFGLDWDSLLVWSSHYANNRFYNLPNGISIQHGSAQNICTIVCQPYWPHLTPTNLHLRIVEFVPDHIELEQTYWVNFPFLREAAIAYRIVGDGRIVPEPSAVFLLIEILFLSSRLRLRLRR